MSGTNRDFFSQILTSYVWNMPGDAVRCLATAGAAAARAGLARQGAVREMGKCRGTFRARRTHGRHVFSYHAFSILNRHRLAPSWPFLRSLARSSPRRPKPAVCPTVKYTVA